MARTGRPKADKPFDHKVTVKFKEEEYQIMVEYAETHNLSISQLIRKTKKTAIYIKLCII